MSEDPGKITSPWLSIWLSPRRTMRRLEQRDPDELILLLVSFAGFSQFLVSASRFNLGDHISIPVIFTFAVVLGPVIGIIGLLVAAFLLHWTGTWLGGKADYAMLRAAIAWSLVPVICYTVLWVPKYFLLGEVLFTSRVVLYGSKAHLLIVSFNVLHLAIVIWSVVIFLNCLGEVQKFAVWKVLGNCALSLAIFLIAGLFIAAVIAVTIN